MFDILIDVLNKITEERAYCPYEFPFEGAQRRLGRSVGRFRCFTG